MATSIFRGLLFLLSSSIAFASPLAERQDSVVLLPSQDPFFQPNAAALAASSPGDILDHRQIAIPQAINLLAPGKTASAWQILYSSQDDTNTKIAVVTTFFVPKNGDPNKFFTYGVAYDSSDVDCSPSYTLRSYQNTTSDSIPVAIALSNGWYTQSPDFESFKGGFTNGIISGQTLLDSLRASKKSGYFTGLSSDPKIGLNGGSGGALACEWALELQPTYATDITFTGVSLGVLTPNTSNVYVTVNKGPAAGLIPSSITGLASVNSTFDDYLTTQFVSSAAAANFRSAKTRCLSDNNPYYQGQDIFSYFKDGIGLLNDPIPHYYLNHAAQMGQQPKIPNVPIYAYKGVFDEVSPVADTDALIATYCKKGVKDVTYIRNPVTEHVTEGNLGIFGALAWLNDRFNGVPVVATVCPLINATAKSSLSSADFSLLGGNFSILALAAQAVLTNPALNLTSWLQSLGKN